MSKPKIISELKIIAEDDPSVAGVVRNEKLHSNPDQFFRLKAYDRIAIIGTDSAREKFYQLTLAEPRKFEKNNNQN